MSDGTITKAELARKLGISKSRVSQLVIKGLPVELNGRVKLSAALNWLEQHASSANGSRLSSAARAVRVNPLPWLSRDQLAMLAEMRLTWPALMQRTVRHLGGDERAAALAVLVLQELTEHLAIALPNDLSLDVPDILPRAPVLEWSADVRSLVDSVLHGEPGWEESREGTALSYAMMDAGGRAAGRSA